MTRMTRMTDGEINVFDSTPPKALRRATSIRAIRTTIHRNVRGLRKFLSVSSFRPLAFGFVSDFELRISDLAEALPHWVIRGLILVSPR